tara:strand:+ start:1371 stop:1580 length:210 start_codon:yes stop_codon:yes gene_type:complete
MIDNEALKQFIQSENNISVQRIMSTEIEYGDCDVYYNVNINFLDHSGVLFKDEYFTVALLDLVNFAYQK